MKNLINFIIILIVICFLIYLLYIIYFQKYNYNYLTIKSNNNIINDKKILQTNISDKDILCNINEKIKNIFYYGIDRLTIKEKYKTNDIDVTSPGYNILANIEDNENKKLYKKKSFNFKDIIKSNYEFGNKSHTIKIIDENSSDMSYKECIKYEKISEELTNYINKYINQLKIYLALLNENFDKNNDIEIFNNHLLTFLKNIIIERMKICITFKNDYEDITNEILFYDNNEYYIKINNNEYTYKIKYNNINKIIYYLNNNLEINDISPLLKKDEIYDFEFYNYDINISNLKKKKLLFLNEYIKNNYTQIKLINSYIFNFILKEFDK